LSSNAYGSEDCQYSRPLPLSCALVQELTCLLCFVVLVFTLIFVILIVVLSLEFAIELLVDVTVCLTFFTLQEFALLIRRLIR